MTVECYFSHSWAAKDVPINLMVWESIADACVLYVDREGAATGEYYINRLEELIRKSDVFVSVLPYRDVEKSAEEWPDYQLSCSAGCLFEIRLAERARKPRWIIYDDRTGFKPCGGASDLVVYTPIDADEELARDGSTIRSAGKHWIESVSKLLRSDAPRSRTAALLVDEQAADAVQVRRAVEQGLDAGAYTKIQSIEPFHTDGEVVSILQASGLLVAETGSPALNDVYGMAHALFIPAIRFRRQSDGNGVMPRLLDGHPGGYQHDFIAAADLGNLAGEIAKRANAMRDSRAPIAGKKAGCAYLQRQLYRPHQLFFSHNLSDADADLLQRVFEKLESLGVRAWEYRHDNHAGVVWQDELRFALSAATDVAFIFDNDFELSKYASDELDDIVSRRTQLASITPFLWGGRTRANPKLGEIHHEMLPSDKAVAAERIVDRVVQKLLRA